MKTLCLGFTAAALVVLSGCATKPAAPVAAAESGKNVAAAGDAALVGPTQTGTMMPKKGNERHVRSVGNQSFREEENIRSLGNLVGARGN